MCIRDIELPSYSLKEELWNSISHGLGAIAALIMAPFFVIKAIERGTVISIISVSIYLFAFFITFLFSCLYHGLGRNNGKRVFRILDHDGVFLLIMGSYAPFSLVALYESGQQIWGSLVFCFVDALSILGIVLNSINIKKYAVLSYVLYIGLGSTIVLALYPLYLAKGFIFCLWLFLSGCLYWMGAMLYAFGKKKSPKFHVVFHFFILAAALSMALEIYFLVL